MLDVHGIAGRCFGDMSPPVQRNGKPVKKLNRRELSCVPFLLSLLLHSLGQYDCSVNHEAQAKSRKPVDR
jgi:hypothetical protein